eukprot:12406066-Karenia_brevis.AAC.1
MTDHNKKHERDCRQVARVAPRRNVHGLGEAGHWSHAMWDHFKHVGEVDSFYCLPAAASPILDVFDQFTDTPATCGPSRDGEHALLKDSVFFQVVETAAGWKKTVRVAPGAGRKLARSDVIVN